jgi:hypothetical protein
MDEYCDCMIMNIYTLWMNIYSINDVDNFVDNMWITKFNTI